MSTTATLVSANELRQDFDDRLDLALGAGATTDGRRAAWLARKPESDRVGWPARAHTDGPGTPARTSRAPTASIPPESGATREERSPSPAASYPDVEPRQVDSIEKADDTGETTRTHEPSPGTAEQGQPEAGNGAARPQHPADEGPDGTGDDDQRADDSEADAGGAGGDRGGSEPQDDGGPSGDPEDDDAGESEPDEDDSGHGEAGHEDSDDSDDGRGHPQRSGAERP